eukprot:CAMPEP_0172441908 /NCGR_PEP_ID=MMETSP1065-20121228/2408_1 /TAXON_ID=265537 /ORGANISM="Amphiprora paludosa, Strain CCMP125" /LENGTH=747 /DNA_ID=CAMNT_0013191527 /DNA_START=8 /DNA_END=2251 /DNA_ORIENTATION=-
MASQEVIELSVDETNRLRAELGLAPLRVVPDAPGSNENLHRSTNAATQPEEGEEVLELGVDETNALREKLGLPRLRDSGGSKDQHAPAPNNDAAKKAAERIEKSKMKRQVQEGLSKFESSSLAAAEKSEGGSLLSWAKQMKQKKQSKSAKSSKKVDAKKSKQYGETDLKGLNVAHSMNELEQGSTTVLTLADSEILDLKDDASKKVVGLNEDGAQLENVNLSETQKQRDGLKEKRQVELGMGRAGGYAGFDDDEFMELGGAQGPSKSARVDKGVGAKAKRSKIGFQIGSMLEEQEQETDLFAAQSGKAVSLESRYGDTEASDFLTAEEEEKLNPKKKKKPAKFKKKKKDKKDKRKKRKLESDDEEDSVRGPFRNNLVAELEETAKSKDGSIRLPRKRRLSEDGYDASTTATGDAEAESRSKYAAIMQKGNERTKNAFLSTGQKANGPEVDDEPDDAFLHAALSKARRLNRLKQLSGSSNQPRGEDAILEAVKSGQPDTAVSSGNGKVIFSIDETREFTRAIRAREEQSERVRAKAAAPVKKEEENSMSPQVKVETVDMDIDDPEEDLKISELAKEIKVENEDDGIGGGLDGKTAASVGRGLGGVLSMLKQTGEITKKNAGREEQRGRAKDERTYEDYAALDLASVVQLDERTATDKDKEIANREVKLEYRDDHGRLLTRKEAFRELSYQFHGYGSGKRKQEKKLQQIAREQAEQRLQSKQASEGGILGALKATQKATGKAFIVHKTT